jgi:hypothetical protein
MDNARSRALEHVERGPEDSTVNEQETTGTTYTLSDGKVVPAVTLPGPCGGTIVPATAEPHMVNGICDGWAYYDGVKAKAIVSAAEIAAMLAKRPFTTRAK